MYQEGRKLSASIIADRAKEVRAHKLIINFQSCFDLLPTGYPIPPRPSHDLGCRVAISAARYQLKQFISTALYLLSNRLHDPRDGDGGLDLVCSILEGDARQTIKLLHSRLPSIRIAWSSLLSYSKESHRRHTFRLLVDIGIRNSWISARPVDGSLLFYAVKMECNVWLWLVDAKFLGSH